MNEVELRNVSRRIFGISPRHYRRLAEEGHVPSTVKGTIPLLEAVRDLCAYYRGLTARKGTSLEGEKISKLIIERKLKELKLSIQSGDLLPRSEIPKMFSERQHVVAAGLTNLRRSLSRKLPGKDARQMSETIKGEVTHLLDRLSGGVKKKRLV